MSETLPVQNEPSQLLQPSGYVKVSQVNPNSLPKITLSSAKFNLQSKFAEGSKINEEKISSRIGSG